HEVNIKILLTDVMADSKNGMTLEKRNRLLESMTDEVASLVLQHNYQQTQGISLTETQAAEHLTVHADWIRDLERYEGIDRVLEGLPGEEEIESRQRAGKGLTRPELAVLFSYAKITFAKDLLASDIPDLPETENWLVDYFPSPLRKKYETVIRRHRLRREIVATSLASTMVNRLGPTFVKECMEKTGAAPSDVARAYLIVRAAFDLETLGKQVEALDNLVPAAVQLAALRDISAMAGREVLWFLTRLGRELNVSEDIREFRTGISQLQATLDDVLTEQQTRFIKQRTDQGIADGLQPDLAHRIAMIPRLGAACDIIRISLECKTPIPLAARVYFAAGEHFPLHWLRKQARYIATDNRWTSEALDGLIDQLYSCQTGLATRILTDMKTEIKRASCGPSG
ncbi:MAG: NAD-glutamate dehydrogenase, partial [Alphaproteobacteria bacterium]|nr:NAD-glutamate dehydrogenase [Alphaproteobacteria bacterium]